MLLITKRRKIGKICGHTIYAISKSEMVPIPHATVLSKMAHSKNENRSLVNFACNCNVSVVHLKRHMRVALRTIPCPLYLDNNNVIDYDFLFKFIIIYSVHILLEHHILIVLDTIHFRVFFPTLYVDSLFCVYTHCGLPQAQPSLIFLWYTLIVSIDTEPILLLLSLGVM